MTQFMRKAEYKIGKYFVTLFEEHNYQTGETVFTVYLYDSKEESDLSSWTEKTEAEAVKTMTRIVEMCEITQESEQVEIAC